jgi:hypothetical protein
MAGRRAAFESRYVNARDLEVAGGLIGAMPS